MQAEEPEKSSIEEKSKLFVQLLEARKKHFAAIRAQEKRNKPPTKAQKRKTMYTYLKNKAGYKHNQLKYKSFDDIHNEVSAEGSQTRTEGSFKRPGEELEQESSKKQKLEQDKESEELKKCLEIVPYDGDDVTIDATPLSIKLKEANITDLVEGSSKRAREELEQDNVKKQKVDDDKETA
ncbi:hypothetical protein Tco_1455722 [Tanacetum coccineum]